MEDEVLASMLADIETLVRCESPSADLSAVAASADAVARLGTRHLGVAPERIVLDGRTHLRWRLGTGPRRVLLLGHHDTVWPIGSLADHPFSVNDGVLRGPGCLDMKAGLVLALHAVAALPDASAVTILVTGDEEVGSPSSRELIESEAAGCLAVLVLEAAADGGALKTERKGGSLYRIRVVGRAAHAGLEPERGVNATVELAHQVLAIGALADPGRGTTVTPTLMAAGSTTNTIPALGELALDVRVRDVSEQARVDAAVWALRPVLAGAHLEVSGGPNRPPLSTTASAGLFARAAALAGDLGLPPLVGAAVGGASDGNFTAGIGIPTLDGLGAVGGGAHAADEHVLIRELPGRAVLLTALVADLLTEPPPSVAVDADPEAAFDAGPEAAFDAGPEAAFDAAEKAADAAHVTIREVTDLAGMAAVYRLFDGIWRPDPTNPPVTAELLRALTSAGNYVAGAFDGDALVGACVGFFRPPAEKALHSHIAGVHGSAVGRSVGYALKLHQRAWAMSRGVRAITWTFDPLVRRNAYFNLAKLAAAPTQYLPNFYGGMHDGINGDDDSDRLLVRWDLAASGVVAACAAAQVPADAMIERARGALVALDRSAEGLPILPVAGLSAVLASASDRILVAVPLDIEALRTEDPGQARQWRLALREVLVTLMAGGARVTGFDRSGWYIATLTQG